MIDNTKIIEFPNSFINSVDWEYEAAKNSVYLQEDMHAFYHSLNDPGKVQIEAFMNNEMIDIKAFEGLQEKAKLNPAIPASIIVKGDKRLLKYYERQINALPF